MRRDAAGFERGEMRGGFIDLGLYQGMTLVGACVSKESGFSPCRSNYASSVGCRRQQVTSTSFGLRPLFAQDDKVICALSFPTLDNTIFGGRHPARRQTPSNLQRVTTMKIQSDVVSDVPDAGAVLGCGADHCDHRSIGAGGHPTAVQSTSAASTRRHASTALRATPTQTMRACSRALTMPCAMSRR